MNTDGSLAPPVPKMTMAEMTEALERHKARRDRKRRTEAKRAQRNGQELRRAAVQQYGSYSAARQEIGYEDRMVRAWH